ncbi:MAG: hypothetical protein M0P69_04055 [Bacteroidales bacterium]|jgi:V/A-type H+-transporting ATPase subunit I|nr:hypothetical protein [Bacteroidales bacterium]MDD2570326.1 V-type ATPase 116kDa subunit family protein [Bacteroidales bacterium]MDD2812056.1 V-type ATPase 116kDa subunit family protein [Bacteroidales bacterium]MDD3872159.1 V-type ATPase 116kDa subunit family protein [Bacteroidales bacterium]MDD4812262.1 V-type ATPase 116kDa subunit family protein [Bacteroidales bacterium]
MIAPMTKYSFLVYHLDYEPFLDKLRELGIAHIIENNQEVSPEILEQFQQINQVNRVIRTLNNLEPDSPENKPAEKFTDGEELYQEVVTIQQKVETLNQSKALIQKQISDLSPWGNFDLDRLEKLRNQDIRVRLYTCQIRKFDPRWEEEYDLFRISEEGGQIYFALIEKGDQNIEINAEVFPIPSKSLEELKNSLTILEQDINHHEIRLEEIARNGIPAIENYRYHLIDSIEYSKAVHHTLSEMDNHLRIVEVWSPDHLKEELEEMLEQSEAVYIKSRPTSEDKVPVLLKNKKFSKDFEIIGDIYSLPKYGELDLTPFFAPFYALFFGFCLGDVGYGLMMLLGAILFKSKVPKKFKSIMNLVAYLGTATILFGLIGGTFFGINLYESNLPIYSSLQDQFEAKNTNINNYLFYLSLIIGGVQIIFGMILKAINEITQFGWKVAVGTLGWLLLLIGMISLFLIGKFTGVDAGVISVAQKVILGVSGSMILLFNNMNRKIYINLGAGLWNTYNMITGILGDLLSYIRLFALGIASAILGFVFNSLAVSMSGDIPVVSVLIMIIILAIGHAINIFMSGLGAFVHPMRLTFVEFYKNAGFTGGGRKYQPFRRMSN